MRRFVFALFAAFSLAIGLVASVSAQDVLNCDDFGGDQDAAQRVLNENPSDPNQLDGDDDGWACEGVFGYIGSEPNAFAQSGDDTGGDSGAGDGGTTDGGVTDLPDAGVGASLSTGSGASVLGIMASLLLIVGALARRSESFRI